MGTLPETQNAGPPRALGTRLRVLVVEDDANDVELLRLAFKSVLAAPLEVAFNGQEAVDLILAEPRPECALDVIVCDLNMPVMNGFDFLKWLKGESPCPRTPVVVLTSSIVETDVERSYDLGAAAYLVKPSGHEELQALAKALVNFWKLVQSSASRRER